MKKNSMTSNIIFNFISQLITYITPFVLSPYISRVLLPDGVGKYSYAASIAYYFGIVIIFGFANYGTRQIAANRENKEEYSKNFWNILVVRTIFFIISITAYISLKLIFKIPNNIEISIYMAFLLLLIGDFIDVTFLFQGLEKFKIVSIINVVVNIFYMISVFTLVKSPNDLLYYTILKSSIKLVVSSILWLIIINKKMVERPNNIFSKTKDTFIGSLLFFLPSLVMTISPQIDQTMISNFANDVEGGYYQQVQKLISLICCLSYAIAPIMLSRITFLYQNDNEKNIQNSISNLIYFSNFIMIPAVAGLYSISKFFIPAYYGEAFKPAVSVMYLFLPTIIFSSIASLIINGYYYPSKKVIKATLILASTVCLNIVTNIFAIKQFGANGAAFTSTISNFISLLLLMFFSRKKLNYLRILIRSWKVTVSSVIMVLCITLITKVLIAFNVTSDILLTIIGIVFGILIFGITNIILREELMTKAYRILKNRVSMTKID